MRLLSAFANVIEAFARRVGKRAVKRCRPMEHCSGTSSIERLPLRAMHPQCCCLQEDVDLIQVQQRYECVSSPVCDVDAERILTVQVKYQFLKIIWHIQI